MSRHRIHSASLGRARYLYGMTPASLILITVVATLLLLVLIGGLEERLR